MKPWLTDNVQLLSFLLADSKMVSHEIADATVRVFFQDAYSASMAYNRLVVTKSSYLTDLKVRSVHLSLREKAGCAHPKQRLTAASMRGVIAAVSWPTLAGMLQNVRGVAAVVQIRSQSMLCYVEFETTEQASRWSDENRGKFINSLDASDEGNFSFQPCKI